MSAVDTTDPRCLAASEALARGDEGPMRAHSAECGACAFMVTLMPDLRETLGTGGIGRAFEGILEHAMESGELLLSRYRIEHVIARGGQGIVCRAFDREFGAVAIKILRCSPRTREERLPEGRVAMKLGGEGVCRIFNIERHGDIRMVVMELVDGENLEDALPRLSASDRLRIFRSTCEAVARIHKEGIVHLDLKPRNVVLRPGDSPVVTDFGIAAALESDGCAAPLGHTPEYAPREQREGERVDRRADVYALGKMLQRLSSPASPHVRRVIQRATREVPAERYADATAMLDDFDRPSRRWRSIARAAWIAGTFVVALSLGVTGFAAWSAARPRANAPRAPEEPLLVDFDSVETYSVKDKQVEAAPLFERLGIRVSATPGTRLMIGNTLAFYDGRALVPSSPPNVLTQTGSNDPVYFTLTFPRPLAKLTFRRPALVPATESGITFPQWRAVATNASDATNASSSVLATVGEEARGTYQHEPAKEFVLAGDCIGAVRFESDNGHFAAFSAVVVDDLRLVYAAPSACRARSGTTE